MFDFVNKKLTFIILICSVWLNLIVHQLAWARDAGTKKLKENNKLGISFESCKAIENKIGQLFYINVDGYGQDASSTHAISPAYISLVKDLKTGLHDCG